MIASLQSCRLFSFVLFQDLVVVDQLFGVGTNAITVTIEPRGTFLVLGSTYTANDTNLFLLPLLVFNNTAGNAGIFVGANTCANLFSPSTRIRDKLNGILAIKKLRILDVVTTD